MTGIEVARFSLENGAVLFRLREDGSGEYDCKKYFTGQKRGWLALDRFSASAIVQVYDALNDENKKKYGGFSILKMAEVAFKLAKR